LEIQKFHAEIIIYDWKTMDGEENIRSPTSVTANKTGGAPT